jgi:hypothetical protein
MFQKICAECGQLISNKDLKALLKSYINHCRKKRHSITVADIIPTLSKEELEAYDEIYKDEVPNKNSKLLSTLIGKFGEDMATSLYSEYPCCKLCGFVASEITGHIVRTHRMSTEEYSKKTGDTFLIHQDVIASKKSNVSGNKNPMFGKGSSSNSPMSKDFYIKKGMTEEEAINAVKALAKDNASKTVSNTSADYYVQKMGVSLDEAVEMLRDRQSKARSNPNK